MNNKILNYFPFLIVLLSLSIFGFIDSSIVRNLFIFVSLFSFLLHPYIYFKIFKKYYFLQHSILVLILVLIYSIISYFKGNDILSILAVGINFLLYPSIFLIVIAYNKKANRFYHKVIFPLILFLVTTFLISKLLIPLYPTFLDRESGYERIYFHGYQFGVLTFFLVLSIIQFKAFTTINKITYFSIFLGLFLVLFYSYFRAFFILPLIMVFVFFGYSFFKRNKIFFLLFLSIIFATFIYSTSSKEFKERYISANLSNDPTSLSRLILFSTKYEYLEKKGELIFGDGFMLKKGNSNDDLIEDRIMNPLILDNDNGYANLLVSMGWFGVIIFTLSYLRVLKQQWFFFKSTKNSFFKAIYYTSFLFTIYTLLVSFVNDFFVWPYAIIPVLLINALVIWSKEEESLT